uniref:Uncharacterized protein n=1 Tax=Oryza punctata TaxID=4537 RepID=A0A0E0LZW6_ORYPU
MSGQPPPLQPQPFRFWLPYRSNAGSSSRQQPWPVPAQPASPRPQPAPPAPPPTPAERPPRASLARAMGEDIPVQGESSDESDTIPVQSLDSPRWHGARRRPSVPDLELTLSRSPRASRERSPRDGGDGEGNDTKISISGFPRSRLFDGARAPYRREIEDGLKSLATREAPAARADGSQGYRVITLAGHNVGASMVLGGGGGGGAREHGPSSTAAEAEGSARPAPSVAANVNSNVQSVNNSSMEASTCNAGDPGVRVDIKNARDEPVLVAPPKKQQEEEKPKEPVRRPLLAVPAAPQPPRARRCLRALMMESGSDTEAAPKPKPKPKPSACRFQCVADHKPPSPPATTTSNGGGGGGDGKSREEGGKENTR